MNNDEPKETLKDIGGEEAATKESSTEEIKATGEVEEVESKPTGEVETETAETEDEPKKGYQARVRELNARAKQAEAKVQSLSERLAEITGSPEPQADFDQQQGSLSEPIIQPGEEIDAIELDKRLRAREAQLMQRADALVSLRTRQAEAVNRINNEANEAMRKYPQLDPESDSFNRDLSDAVIEATDGYIHKNPFTASVRQFVDKLMKPFNGAVTKEVGKASENLVRQVSQTAQRPTQIRQEEKPDSELTIKELEAKYGIVST